MTAIWTPPITWTGGALVTAAQFREQIRDNLEYLFTPNSVSVDYDEGSNKSTTSTDFVAVDTGGGTELRAVLDTAGEDVAVTFMGFLNLGNSGSNAGGVYFNILVDGTTLALADDGILALYSSNLAGASNVYGPVMFRIIIPGLDPGSHTFDVMWKVSASSGTTTAILYAGAGTSRLDVRPQLDVRKA